MTDITLPCNCSHSIASHRGYTRTAGERQGCLVEGCGCSRFIVAEKADCAKLPAEFHRALNNLRREFNERLDALKSEYLKS